MYYLPCSKWFSSNHGIERLDFRGWTSQKRSSSISDGVTTSRAVFGCLSIDFNSITWRTKISSVCQGQPRMKLLLCNKKGLDRKDNCESIFSKTLGKFLVYSHSCHPNIQCKYSTYKQYPPVHFELPVSFTGYVDVGEVSGVVLGVTSSQNQLSSWCSSWISENFTAIYDKICEIS